MKLFLNKAERQQYLGFDDRLAMALGIPLLALLAFLLFAAGQAALQTKAAYLIALCFTTFYWVGNRGMVILLRRRYPGQQQIVKRLLFLLLTVLFFVFLSKETHDFLYQSLVVEGSYIKLQPMDPLFGALLSFTLCALVLAIYESIYFFAKYNQAMMERERLAKHNMQAQLAILKQQVNPHFLFNSLNTLTNIIPENPQLATLFTQRLAAVYRRILAYRHRDLIPIAEEIAALQDYIFLMEARFEDKLSVRFYCEHLGQWVSCQQTAADDALPQEPLPLPEGALLLPLSLQLLVENAIKHNVVSYAQPLLISIRIGSEHVEVHNPIQLRPALADSTGLGHELIRQRYQALGDQPVRIEQTATDYTVILPLLYEKAISQTTNDV